MHDNLNESHWQQGCDHAKGGIGPLRPYPNAQPWGDAKRRANEGYMNGWRFGRLADGRAYCGRCDRGPAQAPSCPHGEHCGLRHRGVPGTSKEQP